MGLDRRSFIAFLAGGTGGILCTPVVWKLLDDVSIWSQNWPWIPKLQYGERVNKPVACKFGADAYGILVETAAGRPFTARGNPDHPLSKGGIDPMGVASVQMLYSPSRVKSPMKKSGNGFEQISWDEAGKLLADKVKSAGSDVCAVTGDETGTTSEILAGLLAGLGSDKCFFMPGETGPAVKAWKMLGGQGTPGYDLENADFVVSLGGDINESWGTVVRNGKAMAANKAVFTYVGAAQKPGTSIPAKTWIACKPGQEPLVALGVAAYLLKAGMGMNMPGYAAFKDFVTTTNPPSRIAKATGVSEETMAGMAKDLMRARRPLVLTGSEMGQGTNSLGAAAGLALNMILGRVNAKGGVTDIPFAPAVVANAPARDDLLARDLAGYVQAVAKGKASAAKVTLVVDANPAYALPQPDLAVQALEKSDFVVSVTTFMDETAALADLILPASYFLETMDDVYTPFGSGQANYTVSPAIMEPLFDTRPAADVLLALAQAAGVDLGVGSFEDAAKAKAEVLGADWDALNEGTAWVGETVADTYGLTLWNEGFRSLGIPRGSDDLVLTALAKQHLGTAGMPTSPFGVLTIRDTELKNNVLCAQMNSATAGNLGVQAGQTVTVSSGAGSCKAVVTLSESLMPGVVAMPLGFGHTAWDEFAKNKGDNVYKLMEIKPETGIGMSVFGNPQVQITRA
jgi:anaerobic selenocysteine-containing dehydrogenase